MKIIFPASSPRILVVDDSATSRAVMTKQLKKIGCNVTVAQDGASGLEVLNKEEFDLVLLDCQMPDLSGYEVATIYRVQERQKAKRRVRIVAISAETDAQHRQLCLDSGMDDVLGKPLSDDAFTKLLAMRCGREKAPALLTPPEHAHSEALTLLFRSTSFEDLSAMQRSASQADLPSVGRLAHRMKGAALTMKAAPIVATLERIEAIAIGRVQPVAALDQEFDVLREQLQRI